MTKKRKLVGVVGPRKSLIGEDHHRAKISDAMIEHIRDLHEIEGLGYRQIAKKLGMSRHTIAKICTYRVRACTPDGYKSVEMKSEGSKFVYDVVLTKPPE